MKQVFFARQNSLVKLFYILLLALTSALIPFNKFLFLVIIQFLYISNFTIILSWLKIVVKLLPFFISLLAISIVFDTPFDLQLILVARITFILMLSIFLIHTSSIDDFLADTSKWSKHRAINDLRLFLISTMFFIPIFIQLFNEKNKKSEKVLTILPEIIQESFSQIRIVEEKALASLDLPLRKFDYLVNLPPFFMMLINSFLLFY